MALGYVSFLAPIEELFTSWIAAWPRGFAFFALLPLLKKEVMPRLFRTCLVAALCFPLIPLLKEQVHVAPAFDLMFLLILLKEVLLGFMLALPIALLFWAAEAIGTLWDNQSGSLISAVINPMSGNDVATLGIFMHQIFTVYFLLAGGLAWCIDVYYQSYRVWPIYSALPWFNDAGLQWWLEQANRYLRIAAVLAAPVLLGMFMIEFGFGILGRFAQKMQVFILAMPIKNVAAVLFLLIYITALLPHLQHAIDELAAATRDYMGTGR